MGKIILNGTEYVGSGGSGGHTIVDPTGTDMPQENKLQFTGAVNVSDDAVNGQTVVDVEGGGNYYLNTIYSTEEKKVGYWTDGKPLYQRTITYETPFNITNGSWYESSAIYPDMNIVNSDIVNSVFAHYTGAIVTIENSKLVIGNQTKNQPMNNIKYVTIQYTKSTDTADPNPQTGGVIYLPSIYSDEEREVGVWRDGKPLYQKSINIGAVTANTVKVIDITSLNVDYVADYIATAVLTNGWKVPLPQTHTSSMSYQAFCRLSSSTQLAVGVGSSIGISDGYVTLQYTKTTDVAGSGNWNTDGVPTHHYSTNEQVIGTWIDGKPLYEKSFNLPSAITINNASWTSTGVSISNIKNVVDGELNRNGLQKFACSLRAENSVIAIQTYFNGAQCNTDSVVTVRYTKTTDV